MRANNVQSGCINAIMQVIKSSTRLIHRTGCMMHFQGYGGSTSVGRGEKQNMVKRAGSCKDDRWYFPAGRKRPKRRQLGM